VLNWANNQVFFAIATPAFTPRTLRIPGPETSLTLPEQIEGLSEWCGLSHSSGSPNRSHYHSSTHATLFVPMALPSSA
jgi:hypothetical protein